MPKPIINIDDIVMQPWPAGAALSGPAAERYDATMGLRRKKGTEGLKNEQQYNE